MNRFQSVLETPWVDVARFDHPQDQAHRDPPEEEARELSVNFVLRGSYQLKIGKDQWRMTPDQVFVTRPGLTFSCRHHEEIPSDVCLCVLFKDDPPDRGEGDRVRDVLPVDNRLAFLRWRLCRLFDDPAASLEAEDAAAELWQAVAGASRGGRHRYGEAQLAWYAERMIAARETMRGACHLDHSLADLSRGVGMSPFHFARIFRDLSGVPPHQFLLAARLERACEMLDQGASVTETFRRCGFNSASYFSRLFRQRFGVPPSRFADPGSGRRSGRRSRGESRKKVQRSPSSGAVY